MNAKILLVISMILCLSCNGNKDKEPKSDPQLEQMLSGIWVNDEDENVVFKVVGDTIFYNDKNAEPAHFRIYADTLYIEGAMKRKYFVEKLTQNVFHFRDGNGESSRFMKNNDTEMFEGTSAEEPTFDDEIIQTLVKRDTVVTSGKTRYHCYMQVNPTTYKVIKTDYNSEGLVINRVYYDNIVNLTVYEGANRLFSSDFRKQDFAKFVAKEVLENGILSDITYRSCGDSGVVFDAKIRIPESAAGYLVNINISPNGQKTLSQP